MPEELEQLAKEAKTLESKGELHMARDRWLMGLPLLPRGSKQADWIQAHARELELKANARLAPPPPENNWAKKVGPLGALGLLLLKGKALLMFAFKLKFLISLAAFIGVYWTLYGAKFGIGFAVLILIHEMGHLIDVKRRGLPAEMPVFLPGFGAYVKWQALGVPLETRAAVSLAGPLAGCIASAACALVWWKTGDGVWAALARSSAWLNVLNLIPVWMLDGGQAAQALGKIERWLIAVASLALWYLLGEKGIHIRHSRRGIPFVHERHAAASQPQHSSVLHRRTDRPWFSHVDAPRARLRNTLNAYQLFSGSARNR